MRVTLEEERTLTTTSLMREVVLERVEVFAPRALFGRLFASSVTSRFMLDKVL